MDICLAEAQAATALAAAPLQRLPLVVISHGIPDGPPGPERDITERVWKQLQQRLAALQPGADHVVATQSGHDIASTQPDVVLDAVTKVVRAVREAPAVPR